MMFPRCANIAIHNIKMLLRCLATVETIVGIHNEIIICFQNKFVQNF